MYLLDKWLAEGRPVASPTLLRGIAETIEMQGDPPPQEEPPWPTSIARLNEAESEGAQLGTLRWRWLAAHEVTGRALHPSVQRLLGRVLLHPQDRRRYLDAVSALESML